MLSVSRRPLSGVRFPPSGRPPGLAQFSRPSFARTSLSRIPLTSIASGRKCPPNSSGSMGKRMRAALIVARLPGPAHAACGTCRSWIMIVGVKESESSRSIRPIVTGRPNRSLSRFSIVDLTASHGNAATTSRSSAIRARSPPPAQCSRRSARIWRKVTATGTPQGRHSFRPDQKSTAMPFNAQSP